MKKLFVVVVAAAAIVAAAASVAAAAVVAIAVVVVVVTKFLIEREWKMNPSFSISSLLIETEKKLLCFRCLAFFSIKGSFLFTP